MTSYEEALQYLNANQRRAATTIEGPVLVIAGPGTGKTQLLTTRIAHILASTDTLPQNILCLTFTESAAQTMRERLSNLIGQAAYDVTISTYHAFGSELIRHHSDYFVSLGDMQPVDELGIDSILREILAGLPYSNPLKFADMYLGDIKTLISDAKRALLTPEDLTKVAEHNQAFLEKANAVTLDTLAGMQRIDKTSPQRFIDLHKKIAEAADITEPASGVLPLSTLLLQELRTAIEDAEASGKTTSLTKWKNAWLAKDQDGNFVVEGQKANHKLKAAAEIYQIYLTELSARGLYDYDDMILKAIQALEENADFRYTLQEQYLYMLLDEFQDTNGAQLRLIELLTDSSVHEGRPNVLAVGDDDQAIYAFQGANYSHMLQFQQMYRDVLVVPLTENYRSHSNILQLAEGISGQIEQRLHHNFPEINKTLVAKGETLPKKAIIERREAKSDAGQFAWTAKRIKELVGQGMPPSEIAVLAPQHKHLEPLLPFLRQEGIPMRYEKRENVLEDPAINQLLRMSELVLALAGNQPAKANALWAEVLSFDFWNLPTSLIWQLSWQAHDDQENWSNILFNQPELRPIALFFIRLSTMAGVETLETVLDYLIGTEPLDLQEPGTASFRSSFYEHYFGQTIKKTGAGQGHAEFWNLLTNLIVLRARLRDYAQVDGERLHIKDLLAFVEAHRAADIKILNTSPYQEADDAVQLMTAYKAKGQEFQAVFLLGVNDEVWGSKARTQSTRLSIPENLQHIRYAGATNDERLRLFYVALTRAKEQLYLMNYRANYAGKAMTRLKYLSETAEEDMVYSPLLPKPHQKVLPAGDGANPITELKAYWQERHEAAITQKEFRALLKARLERFRLSPTHVTSFIDLEKQGPAYFFMNTILRFPRAPTPTGEFGNAMHETLEWLHRQAKQAGKIPATSSVLKQFSRRLQGKRLNEQDTRLFLERGNLSLRAYLAQRTHTISPNDEVEFNFRNEGAFIGQCHLSGKIDKMIVDAQTKTIVIVDYKTGKSYSRWIHDSKLHRYRHQLYLYKTLIEKSHSWQGYTVTDAYLEFVEPDENGRIQELHLVFDEQEQRQIEQLALNIWQRIQNLEIPDTSEYSQTLKGIEDFENDLRAGSHEPDGQTSLLI